MCPLGFLGILLFRIFVCCAYLNQLLFFWLFCGNFTWLIVIIAFSDEHTLILFFLSHFSSTLSFLFFPFLSFIISKHLFGVSITFSPKARIFTLLWRICFYSSLCNGFTWISCAHDLLWWHNLLRRDKLFILSREFSIRV